MALRAAELNEDAALGAMSEAIGVYGTSTGPRLQRSAALCQSIRINVTFYAVMPTKSGSTHRKGAPSASLPTPYPPTECPPVTATIYVWQSSTR